MCGVRTQLMRASQELLDCLSEKGADTKDCVFLAQSNDGVEVEKNTCYTPITAKVLNYSCKVRGMLQSILLLGYMPPKVRNYQAMLKPVVEQFAKHSPVTGVPVQVHDAFLARDRNIFLVCAWLNNDIRGVPGAACSKSPPAIVGSCVLCVIGGCSHKSTTIVPGAVRALSMQGHIMPNVPLVRVLYIVRVGHILPHVPNYVRVPNLSQRPFFSVHRSQTPCTEEAVRARVQGR